MENSFNKKEIIWTEPKGLEKLKRELLGNRNKSFIVRNFIKLLFFIFIFGFILFYWSLEGKLIGREINFIFALIISVSVSLFSITINVFLYKLFGYCIITLKDDFIFYNKSGRNLKQWNIKKINRCNIINGVFKNKPFQALMIVDKKNKSEIFIINENINKTDLCSFFKDNGLECIEENY